MKTVCAKYQGALTGMTADSVVFRAHNSDSLLTFPLKTVARLEVSRGRHGHPWRGAGIGLLGGALLGAGIGAILTDWGSCGDMCAVGPALFGMGGAAVGYVGGFIAGAFIKTDRWEEVPLDRLRVHPVATVYGRFGLAASLRF